MLENHPNLVEFVKQGNVVLFLGAGASLAAKDSEGTPPPLANQLGKLLSEKFLNNQMSGGSLAEIAECAISDTSTATVQNFVKDSFKDFKPGRAHKLLPKFSWAGLATTNYDLIVEKSYSADDTSPQNLRPIVYDDHLERIVEDENDLPYLKLHGCFDNMGPKSVKLVLSLDQYLDVEEGRKSLFDTFEEWAKRYTFIFVGYGGSDLDIRRFITRVGDDIEDRMRFYFVRPGWTEVENKMWENRKVSTIDADFDGFMEALDSLISDDFRGFRADVKMPPTLRSHFTSPKMSLSKNASLFLQNDAVFVDSIEPKDGDITSEQFFNGNSNGWSFILQKWDVVREISEDIIIEVFLEEKQNTPKECELILLRGYAGAGKTIALKRLSWELTHEHEGFALYIERPSDLNSAAIAELAELTKQRIYVFIDDVGSESSNLKKCVSSLGASAKMVTFVGGVRTNDWSRFKSRFNFIAVREFEMGDLSQKEILSLVQRLTETGCLGELEGLTQAECAEKFRVSAKRNLLVALYEVTKGKPFEEIIQDEYDSLSTNEARAVYLTICLLNRLAVPVRAMLISRIHSIPYSDFKKRLFSPLEGVVGNEYNNLARDYVYFARHPYIAEIVFLRILTDQNDRFEEYFKVIQKLNMAYQSDETALKELTRGRVLNELFSDTTYVEKIFALAEDKSQRNPNIFHQRAVFEMRRKGGDLELSQHHIDIALKASPGNSFFKHTAAELLLRRAEVSDSPSVKERLLRRAERACKQLAKTSKTSHVKHTLAKIGIARAQAVLEQNPDSISPVVVRELIKPAQIDVETFLQTHPDDSYLLDAKAKLAKLIGDSGSVLSSLEAAFESNPSIPYIALQLHSCYLAKNEKEKAEDVLLRCLEEKRNDRHVNGVYGKFLMDSAGNPEKALAHLKRAFVPGDSNFDAQMRYGRECFRARRYADCEEHFSTVRITKFPPRLGTEVLYPLNTWNLGQVVEVHARFAVIRDKESDMLIRSYRTKGSEDLFSKIVSSSAVKYRVGVSMHGLRAIDLTESNAFQEQELLY
ncbi:MAG: SIR2 family protein [Roseibacillus sp.]